MNLDTVVTFKYFAELNITGIDTHDQKPPIYCEGDITKDLAGIVRSKGGVFASLG